MNTIRVLVSGACGSMGGYVSAALHEADDMELVAAVDPAGVGHALGKICPELTGAAADIEVSGHLTSSLQQAEPDVMIDFTTPAVVMDNIEAALNAGVPCVVGTTGFSEIDLKTVDRMCEAKGVPCLIAPNFSIGANLMMTFAAEAAAAFDYAEIIERHHENKKDAPSGTAVKTAELMAEAREKPFRVVPTERHNVEGSRGGQIGNIPIHAVRLPGYVANQEVVFGGTGEVLKISHETTSRECFMPGVLLAVREIQNMTGFTYGLDKILID
ncbi:MAG: 4-hydroxy-tetrahydrodipicolinate reductase [Armatimonadota bacterium]